MDRKMKGIWSWQEEIKITKIQQGCNEKEIFFHYLCIIDK